MTKLEIKLQKQVEKLKAEKDMHKKKSAMYQKGYYMMMDYWDSIYDDEKEKLSKRLERIGL